ncbi:hypothetical protein [Ideonella sp.]|uniref:hypothetical protein n=1 Tax=Ideonella sp. TaxID=1929293 RepID=UPI0035AFE7BE
MKYHHRSTLIAVSMLAGLAGCATPVHFESDPPGAEIVYEQRLQTLGTTPFDLTINDDFGWFSVYRFTATLAGYEPVTLEFRERTPLDAQQVVPSLVRFEMKPKQVASSAAAASSVAE